MLTAAEKSVEKRYYSTLFSPRLQHSFEFLFEKEVLVASISGMFSGFGLKTNCFPK